MTSRERAPVERIAYNRPAEAAQMLGVAQRTVYNMMATGELASTTVGRARLIRASDLRAFMGKKDVRSEREASAAVHEDLPARVVEREATKQAAYVLMFGKRWRCVLQGDRVASGVHPSDLGRA